MAEIASTTFSQTDASNTGALPGLSGTSPPSQIDNSIRALMGASKREHDWRNYTVTSTGSANAYVLTYSVAPDAYYTGQRFAFKTNFSVTGSATVNVNSLGAKTIKKLVAGALTDLSSGDIVSGDYIDLVYDGTYLVWVNKGTASAPSGSITASGYTQTTSRLLGRTTASTGAIEEISVGSGLSLSGGSLSASSSLPAGIISPYGGTSEPAGWLLCYGQAISRTTYADLFTAISTTYGTGDGSTTFNVPDLRGRVVAGQDDMGGTSANRLTNASGGVDGDTLGATGGSETHTLTIAEMPSHTHTGAANQQVASNAASRFASTSSSAATGSTGGDDPHNNVQPTIILNYIIKT